MAKVTVVFGGTKGIGRAIAAKFLENDHNVIVLSRNKENVRTAEAYLRGDRQEDQRVIGLQCDVTSREEVQNAWKAIEDSIGPPDVLVNASGLSMNKLLVQSPPEETKAVIETNLIGSIISSSIALRSMLKRRTGSIINIGSVLGSKGNVGQTVYCATKGGLAGFTKSLAREVASRGVRVNLVAPGFIETDMTAHLDIADIQKRIPLKRIGKPNEVAEAVWFLATSPYITGEVLVIDGGLQLTF